MTHTATQGIAGDTNRRYRPTLKHLFYAMALLGASIVAWGVYGIAVAVLIAGAWMWIFPGAVHLARLRRLTIAIVVGAVLLTWLSAVNSARGCYWYDDCRDNLDRYSMALLMYESVKGTLPPAYIPDDNGKPMHSWRVLVLPYLGRQDIYDAYDFDQPWDSPQNLALAKTSWRDVTYCPTDFRGMPPTHTSYFAVTGPNTAFPGTNPLGFEDIFGKDGSPPLYLIEDHSRSVLWTEPVDLTRAEAVKLLSTRDTPAPHDMKAYPYRVSFRNGAFANGREEYIRTGLSAETARALISIDDGSGASQRAMRQAIFDPDRPAWERLAAGLAFAVVLMLPTVWLWRSSRIAPRS